jgi:hypothetical protein
VPLIGKLKGLFKLFGLFGLFELFELFGLFGLFGLFELFELCELLELFELFELFRGLLVDCIYFVLMRKIAHVKIRTPSICYKVVTLLAPKRFGVC